MSSAPPKHLQTRRPGRPRDFMVTHDHEDLEEIAIHAMGFAQQLLHASGALFTCFDGRGGVHIAASGPLSPLKGQRASLESSIAGQVFFSGCGRLCDAAQTTRLTHGLAPDAPLLSAAIAPVHARGLVIAALALVSPHSDAFGPRELKILQVIAYNIGQRFAELPPERA